MLSRRLCQARPAGAVLCRTHVDECLCPLRPRLGCGAQSLVLSRVCSAETSPDTPYCAACDTEGRSVETGPMPTPACPGYEPRSRPRTARGERPS
jgi:hypothetical protein